MMALLYLEIIASHMVGHLLLDSPIEGLQQCSPPLQHHDDLLVAASPRNVGCQLFKISNLTELIMKHSTSS